jgi:aminomethyltransferase
MVDVPDEASLAEFVGEFPTGHETKRSPLHDVLTDLRAVFTEWNGYSVADCFGYPKEEYWAVRRSAGITDMSALQKFDIFGPDAIRFLNRVLTRNVTRAVDGQALYSPMCDENGGFVDDCIAFRMSDTQFMLVTGGGEKDDEWLRAHAKGLDVSLYNVTDSRANIAVQGPCSRAIIQRVTRANVGELGYYHFTRAKVADASISVNVLLSRTGYTGELGYELFVSRQEAPEVWKALAQAAEPGELRPFGFKALDMLRVEAGLVFCGYEMDATTTPYDVGMGWAVDLSKENFVGKPTLAWAKREGPREVLVGLEMEDIYYPESGARLFYDGRKVGVVTSPSFSPLMEKSIALARVKPEQAHLGIQLQVEMGSWTRTAQVVRIPFYDPLKRRVRL